MLTIHHDEDAEVYLNGKLVETLKGHTRHYEPMLLDEKRASCCATGATRSPCIANRRRAGSTSTWDLMQIDREVARMT